MILPLVLSKIKFQSRIISASPPSRQGLLGTMLLLQHDSWTWHEGIGTGSCVLTLPGY
jgi:hypothetical protein